MNMVCDAKVVTTWKISFKIRLIEGSGSLPLIAVGFECHPQ